MASKLSPAPSDSSRASGPSQDLLGGFRFPEPAAGGPGPGSEASEELSSHARTAGQASTSGAPAGDLMQAFICLVSPCEFDLVRTCLQLSEDAGLPYRACSCSGTAPPILSADQQHG